MSKLDGLDDFSKRFLGGTPDNVQVMHGQRSNAKRQQELYAQYLLNETCEFGDILIHYIMAHADLTSHQKIWGFALSIFCLREDYPDGLEEFDTIFDQAGDDLEDTNKSSGDQSELPNTPVFTPIELHKAARFSESHTNYVTQTKERKGFANTQVVYALGRAFHTLRYSFPQGSAVFDTLVERANLYFEEHKGER